MTTASVRRSAVESRDGTTITYQSLGSGEGMIVVGGALRTGDDYLPFARGLARSFAVHVVDRRGRGASGPQGREYSLDRECEDLLAVQAETGATAVFGHSYGGLVALEAARHTEIFSAVAAYEPGVPLNGSIRFGWFPRYRELLAAGDGRGAFASMVRESGAAPGAAAKLPQWCLRAILRLAIRKHEWQRMEPLLGCNLAEHEQEALLDDTTVDRYQTVTARVLLLGGRKTAPSLTTALFEALEKTIPDTTIEILEGLDHFAPDEKAPAVIAGRVGEFLRSRPEHVERVDEGGLPAK
jgi:pimeloyl-ACP methyl ester carboxylesterase